MQLRKAVENDMFPHFIVTFQWALFVVSLAFDFNFSITVTGAMANGGLKVIMLFHLWMLFFSVVLCMIFYRIRKKGSAERCIVGLSMVTILFSIANVCLHFVNNFVLLMKATEVVAWSLYNSMFSVSIYRILAVFLLPVLMKLAEIKKETLHNDERLWAQGQKCEGHH